MNEEALKARLKLIAFEKDMLFNQVWKQLLLERFLARLSYSGHRKKFIFKGGLLLATYLDIGRETMDIDFSLNNLNSNVESIKVVVEEICDTYIDDNMSFCWDRVESLEQPHMQYLGFRVFLCVNFGKMKDKIQIDIGVGVGVGDISDCRADIFPLLEYKGQPIFKKKIELLMYPVEMIFAEKLETIVSKGEINSRMKDYHDLLLMIRSKKILKIDSLSDTIEKIFNHRNTELNLPIIFDDESMKTLQQLWVNHIRGLAIHKVRLKIPDTITEVLDEINMYLTKVLPAD